MKHLRLLSAILILSSCSPKGDINYENLKRVSVGMSQQQVVDIMGEPVKTQTYINPGKWFSYQYDSPFGASDHLYVNFSNRDSLVVSKIEGH